MAYRWEFPAALFGAGFCLGLATALMASGHYLPAWFFILASFGAFIWTFGANRAYRRAAKEGEHG